MSQFEYETEAFEFGPGEMEYQETGEFGGELAQESPLHEVQEMELAQELLEIQSEQELEQFLGNIFKSVGRAVGGIVRSPVGRALGGILKNVAKRALPVVGGALGSMVAPGIGTALGSKLGSMASNLFELELEGLDREQAEFEVARRYVQLAATAAQNAALAPPNVPPRVVAQQAVAQAAQRYAPGLVRDGGMGAPIGGNGGYGGGRARSGRWVRRGRKIVVLGA